MGVIEMILGNLRLEGLFCLELVQGLLLKIKLTRVFRRVILELDRLIEGFLCQFSPEWRVK